MLTAGLRLPGYESNGQHFAETLWGTCIFIVIRKKIAREAVIDEVSLGGSLIKGKIVGVALDVLGKEPPDSSHPLFRMSNLIPMS